jgi:hypothetical protein
MAQNNKLKRQAQAFAAKHGVSYTVALKAVDEPLHELRDLGGDRSSWQHGTGNRFRIVPRQGSYGYAFDKPVEPWYSISEEFGLSRYKNSMAFLQDLVARDALLEAASAGNIWEYRELHRSGLLGKDAAAMEPFFHHYNERLDPASYGQIEFTGHSHGIFPVNIAEFLRTDSYEISIPVTQDQLQALSEGRPVGHIENLLQITEFDALNSNKRVYWEDNYRFIARSNYYARHGHFAMLTIFFKRDLESFYKELESRDLDPEDFNFEELSPAELKFEGVMTYFSVEKADGEPINGDPRSYCKWLWD